MRLVSGEMIGVELRIDLISRVRGIFVPYLSLSFRVQVPGGPTGVPKFLLPRENAARRSGEFHKIELLRARVWL